MFRALANKPRRRLLVELIEHDPQDGLPIPEAVHRGEKELELLHEEIIHIHLPMLDTMGLIQWDSSVHEVSRGPQFEKITPLLRLLLNHTDELPEDIL